VITLRIDESLYFANARYLEDTIYEKALQSSSVEHVILMCSAVNDIDLSANIRLQSANITFHLSEVKGPVMDKLKRSHLLHELTGEVFTTQHRAIQKICGNAFDIDMDYHL